MAVEEQDPERRLRVAAMVSKMQVAAERARAESQGGEPPEILN